MEMNKALKQLIDAKGYEFLKSPMIVNILGDYNAFDEHHSSKYIFKTLVNEGYLEKILFLHENQMPIVVDNYIADLYDKYGLRKDVCHYVLNSLLLGLGYDVDLNIKNSKEETLLNNNTIKPVKAGKHLTFKGIEINGSPDDIRTQLECKGISFMCRDGNYIFLKGDFAANENCDIVIISNLNINLVWCIQVNLPEQHVWNNLKAQYMDYKKWFTKKYGNPVSNEFFNSPYEEGDGNEMTAISSYNCLYYSIFYTTLGRIEISITSNGKLCISYIDNYNFKLHSEAKNIQIYLDI